MAKTRDEIKELLSTDLFKSGIANNYITVNSDGSYITYHCKNNTRRKLCNPEEFVQATAYLKLIFDYNYSPLNISVNENVQVGSSTKEADILVYNEKNSKILIVVECKEVQINERQFQVAVDQAYSYAHSLASQYIWVTSGIKDEYFEIVELYPVERISITDIPKRAGKVDRYKYIKGTKEPQAGTLTELRQKFMFAKKHLFDIEINERINREILGGERAAYGKQIVAILARQLTEEYGKHEFSEKNLNRMHLFASRFQDMSIWTLVASKLSWSYFQQVIPIGLSCVQGRMKGI